MCRVFFIIAPINDIFEKEHLTCQRIDFLSKYCITGTIEVVYNPSYEQLFEEETKPTLEGYEKGQESELGGSKRYDRRL